MNRPAVFVTGASGFVGRRFVPALAATGRRVIVLERRGGRPVALGAGVSAVRGDLAAPETYADALQECGLVVHLAAATGKASRAEHFRVNALGTETVIEACRAAGVPALLFVSSIATTFTDTTGYHYAHAKQAAERAVRTSGLRWAIVRPTMVFGEGSPVENGLAALATLPVVVVPGTGRVRVQPVQVEALVARMVDLIANDRFTGETIEIGGPEVTTIEELMMRLRLTRRGDPGRVVHVPVGVLRQPALLAERMGLGALLPITAGQLASFVNDSIAAPAPLTGQDSGRLPPPRPGPTVTPAPPETLDRECRTFMRHLLGVDGDAFVHETYRAAVGQLPALQPQTPFDALLLDRARRGVWWTRLGDAYAGLFARDSALRRRLVLLLAILESRAPFHQRIDVPAHPPGTVLWARVSVRVIAAVAMAGAGVLVFAPTRSFMALVARGRR